MRVRAVYARSVAAGACAGWKRAMVSEPECGVRVVCDARGCAGVRACGGRCVTRELRRAGGECMAVSLLGGSEIRWRRLP